MKQFSSVVKLNFGFYLTATVLIFAWLAVTYLTRNALASDGAIQYGFPLPFLNYSCGPIQQGMSDNCSYNFRFVPLAIDLSLLFCAPILFGFITYRYQSGLAAKKINK